MKNLVIIGIIFFASKIFAQDIRGVYFHSKFDNTANRFKPSITLFTDASMNISRPTISVYLGAMYGNSIFPLTGTNTVNGTLLSTYSRTLVTGSYWPYYLDSFCVAGIRNSTGLDDSKIKLLLDLNSHSSVENTSPEAGNLPLSPSSFTVSGNQVFYNPNFTDADGDSLSYSLNCNISGSMLTDAAYSFSPTVTNLCRTPVNATINPTTGLFSFSKDSTDLGYYYFSINVIEWRKISGPYFDFGRSILGFLITTNSALGIRNYQSNSFSLGLYPNPAKETLSFKSGTINENEKVKLKISNALGEVVIKKDDFDFTQSLDVSFLQQGVYFINVSNGVKTHSNKFVKVQD